jgi:hypothetical protein
MGHCLICLAGGIAGGVGKAGIADKRARDMIGVITEPVNAPQIANRAMMETTDAKRFGDTALSSPKVTVFRLAKS